MRWTPLTLVLTFSAGLVACGDDDPSDPDNEGDLTEAEAAVMMEALVAAGGFGLDALGGGGPAGVAVEYDIETSAPCPGGGSIAIDGHLSGDVNQDGTGTYNWVLAQDHRSCVATSPSDGSTWTFDGSPDVTLDFDMDIDQTSFTMDGTQRGGISWSSGFLGTGTCNIDVTYSFSGNQSGSQFSGTVSGTICGFSVNESVSITG